MELFQLQLVMMQLIHGMSFKDNIKSSMIWGSQYDAMLNWLSDGENALKIKETNDENHNKSLSVAGSMISDKWKNIYDLEGNLREWTLECSLDDCRVTRGGNFNSAHSPSYRNNTFVPYNTGADNGSRITLFIK